MANSVVGLLTRGDSEDAAPADQVYRLQQTLMNARYELRGARKNLLKGEDEAQLIVLIDSTAFGGCKEGIALFPTYIAYKAVAENKIRIFYSELGSSVTAKGSNVVTVRHKLSTFQSDASQALARFLNTILPFTQR